MRYQVNWAYDSVNRRVEGSSVVLCESHVSAATDTPTKAAFLKLWFADHKWSSGSALVVLLD